MRGWIQVALLGVAAVVGLGTSKQLRGKKLLAPKVSKPAGITVEGEPRAHLAENVNNQGCFARQRLDFRLDARIRNGTTAPLRTRPDGVTLTVGFEKDKQTLRVHVAEFVYKKAQKAFVRGPLLPAGAEGSFVVRAPSILPKSRLEKVRWVRLEADLGPGRLTLEFEGVQKRASEHLR